jgi:hypothetical protein
MLKPGLNGAEIRNKLAQRRRRTRETAFSGIAGICFSHGTDIGCGSLSLK